MPLLPEPVSRSAKRGAALVEMAILLPVLILCFVGVVELGQYLMLAERVTKTSNQLAAVLYTMQSNDLQAGGGPNGVVAATMEQAKTLARPFHGIMLSVRYCQRDLSGANAGTMREIYKGLTSPVPAECGDGPPCQTTSTTQNGFGAFVQTYACQTFHPAIAPRFLTTGLTVHQTSIIPLVASNQTTLLEEAHGVEIAIEDQSGGGGGGGNGGGGGGGGGGGDGSEKCDYPTVRKTGGGCIDACLLYSNTTNPLNPEDPNTVQGCMTLRKQCEAAGLYYVGGACVLTKPAPA